MYISRLIAALCVALACVNPALASERPNVVVIMTDDQDDMGSLDHMPFIQRMMVERGTRFVNSFVDTSICCPSRATLFTGQSAINHGVRTNAAPDGGYAAFAPREDNALGVWLQRSGYKTAIIGKVLNEYGDDDATHVPPGWTEFYGLLRPAQAYFGSKVNENGTVVQYGSNDYVTDIVAAKAVDYINRHGSGLKPFFLLVTSPAPHDSGAVGNAPKPAPRHDGMMSGMVPDQAPNFNEADVSDKPWPVRSLPPFTDSKIAGNRIKRQKRAETLMSVDEMVRDIIRALRNKDALDNTYIIFTSDNGYSLGAHRWDKKYLPYEESIRVPLVIRGPGVPENEIRAQLVGNVDLPATIIDLTGALPGNALDGRSLVSVIDDAATPWRTVLGIHGFDPGQSFKAARTDRYKFAQYMTACCGIEEEFYDLASDPFELNNSIADPANMNIVKFMRDAATTLAACVGDGCFIETLPPHNPE